MDKFAAMRVFVRIADAGNLSAAGRQLGLSLTSVSRQLMALEEVLGTTLVERTTCHLSLTESGPTLLRTGEAESPGEVTVSMSLKDDYRRHEQRDACEREYSDHSLGRGRECESSLLQIRTAEGNELIAAEAKISSCQPQTMGRVDGPWFEEKRDDDVWSALRQRVRAWA
jgi:hypothetical protein